MSRIYINFLISNKEKYDKIRYNLQEQGGRLQFFNFIFQTSRHLDYFTCLKFHIVGPKNDNDSVSWYIKCT